MNKFIIDETGKVQSYIPTTWKVVEAEVTPRNFPNPPKEGVDYVEYWNEKTGKIDIKEERRPLTLEERIAAAESKADASMEAIAEIYEQGNK